MWSCCLWPWCWDPAPWKKPRSPSEGPCSLSWVQVVEVSRGGRGPEGLETTPVLLLITATNFVNHSSSFPIIPLYSNFFDLYSTLGAGKNHHSADREKQTRPGLLNYEVASSGFSPGCLIPVFCHSHHHPQPPSTDLRSSEGRNVKQKNMRCSPLLLSKSKDQEGSNHMMTSYPLGFLTVVMEKKWDLLLPFIDSIHSVYARHGASHR